MNQKFNKLKAFTIIELLVVIGIIGILSAIGVVSFGAVREKARRGACIATLRSNFNSDENLVAYWNFDESLGTQEFCSTAKDFWGNNGACKPTAGSNAPQYTTNKEGIIDYGLSFDNVDDYVALSKILDIGSTSNTVEVWVKVPVNANRGIVLGNWPDPFNLNSNVELEEATGAGGLTGSRLRFWWRNGEINTYLGPDNIIDDNKWHHVAWIRDKSQNKMFGYIDGVQYIYNITAGTDIKFTTVHYIGKDKRDTPGVTVFNGLLDEVIIYNRALSADEIASHYKACKK